MRAWLAGIAMMSVVAGAWPASWPFQNLIRVPLPVGFRASAVAAADFDRDGHVDLAVAGDRAGRVLILRGEGSGWFKSAGSFDGGAHPSEMKTGDANGDGNADLLIANHDTDYVTLLLGNGKGTFTTRRIRVHSRPHPHTIAFVGRNIVVDSWMENRLMLYHAPEYTRATSIDVGRKPYVNVIAIDVNGDGTLDLVCPNPNSVSILLGPDFRHAPQSPIVGGIAPFAVAAGDINADGHMDIVVANYSGQLSDHSRDGVSWILNLGQRFIPGSVMPRPAGIAPTRIATGDINADGHTDAVTSNFGSSDVSVFFGGGGLGGRAAHIAVMRSPHAIVLADVDHDRRADLIVTSEEVDEVYVLRARNLTSR